MSRVGTRKRVAVVALRFPGWGCPGKSAWKSFSFLVYKSEPRQPLQPRFCSESGWTFRSRGAPPPRGREPEVSAGGEGEAGEGALLGAAPKMPLLQKAALQENGSVVHAWDTRYHPFFRPLVALWEGLSSFQPEPFLAPFFLHARPLWAASATGVGWSGGGLLNRPAKARSLAAAPSPAGFPPCRRRRFPTSGA